MFTRGTLHTGEQIVFMLCMPLSKGSRILRSKVSVYSHLERGGGGMDLDLSIWHLGLKSLDMGSL